MSIGSQIRKTRIARGMNMTSLANILGVSTSAVSNWEADKMVPRPHMIPKIAQALGIDRATLVNGSFNEAAGRPRPNQIDAILEKAKGELAEVLNVPAARLSLEFSLKHH